MKRKRLSVALRLLGTLVLGYGGVAGQEPLDPLPGGVDLSFEPGSAINGSIRALAPYDDGQWILGGDFSAIHGTAQRGIARLNEDGSVDGSFLEGLDGFDGTIAAVAVQPDGKILVGGSFQAINGQDRRNLVRLHADGTVDTAFDADVNGLVQVIVLPDDETILIGGDFTEVNAKSRRRLARLDLDGALDGDLNPSVDDRVHAIAIQNDGMILIGGRFKTIMEGGGLVERHYVARLHADGAPDASFIAGGAGWNEGINDWVEAISVQNDGKILIGGGFSRVGGESRAGVARLNEDGTLDGSFGFDSTIFDPYEERFGVFTSDGLGRVHSIVLQDDEKILIAGLFSSVNGEGRNSLARLRNDGSVDETFAQGLSEFSGGVFSTILQTDGTIVAAGGLQTTGSIAKMDAYGQLDESFLRGTPGVEGGSLAEVRAIALEQDGAILIGGTFSKVQREVRGGIARFHPDGELDEGFGSGLAGAGGPQFSSSPFSAVLIIPSVAAIEVQPDGKILAGGEFTFMNDEPRNGVARLHPDGSLDHSFGDGMEGATRENEFGSIRAITAQGDGQILIGGRFDAVNGEPRNGIARLNEDGTLDHVFGNGLSGVDGAVEALGVQEDGKIIIAGSFTAINDAPRNRIARLRADGSLDESFLNGLPGADHTVLAIAVQPDGRILIAGWFTMINGQPRGRIARLNADGSLDVTFGEELGGSDGTIQAIALQDDGRIIIGGRFGAINGSPKNHIARLYPNGALDATFGYGADGMEGNLAGYPPPRVAVAVMQDDGNVLIGGNFTVVNRTGRDRIARLYGGRLAAGYQGWAVLLPDGRRDAGDDPGGHGIPNILRYAFGMDPLLPERERLPHIGRSSISEPAQAPKAMEEGEKASLYLTLIYTRRTDDPALVYLVEESDDLVGWAPFEGVEEVTDDGNGETETVSITDTEPMAEQGRRFLRVRVDL